MKCKGPPEALSGPVGSTCGQLRLRRSPLRSLVLLCIGHVSMWSMDADDQLFAYAMTIATCLPIRLIMNVVNYFNFQKAMNALKTNSPAADAAALFIPNVHRVYSRSTID